MKLEEHEMLCSRCDGSGVEPDDVFRCTKCYGVGKVDWITNATIVPHNPSSLDRINTRILYIHVKKMIEEVIEASPTIPNSNIRAILAGYLETVKQKRGIADYTLSSSKENHININVQPAMHIDMINMDFTIVTSMKK